LYCVLNSESPLREVPLYFQTPFPVPSLNQLSLHHREDLRSFCSMPDFVTTTTLVTEGVDKFWPGAFPRSVWSLSLWNWVNRRKTYKLLHNKTFLLNMWKGIGTCNADHFGQSSLLFRGHGNPNSNSEQKAVLAASLIPSTALSQSWTLPIGVAEYRVSPRCALLFSC